jgi:hypothetical protein
LALFLDCRYKNIGVTSWAQYKQEVQTTPSPVYQRLDPLSYIMDAQFLPNMSRTELMVKRANLGLALAAMLYKPPPVTPIFGGIFTANDCHRQDWPNYQTGSLNCLPGYKSYQVSRHVDPETRCGATSYICLASLNATATFGGMYQALAGGGGSLNPLTNALSCPPGIQDHNVGWGQTDQPHYPNGSWLHLCANFPNNDNFGGVYNQNDYGGGFPNPATGSYSCPVGYGSYLAARLLTPDWTGSGFILCAK